MLQTPPERILAMPNFVGVVTGTDVRAGPDCPGLVRR